MNNTNNEIEKTELNNLTSIPTKWEAPELIKANFEDTMAGKTPYNIEATSGYAST